MCLPFWVEKKPKDSEEKMLLGFAFLWVLFQNRKYRRNLLFGSTIVTMLMAFVGSVFLIDFLSKNPILFAIYWMLCLLMVGFVFILAFYDLLQVRKEHRVRMRVLDRELQEATIEARRIAAQVLKDEGDGSETDAAESKPEE